MHSCLYIYIYIYIERERERERERETERILAYAIRKKAVCEKNTGMESALSSDLCQATTSEFV